jgi:hypothetical protein
MNIRKFDYFDEKDSEKAVIFPKKLNNYNTETRLHSRLLHLFFAAGNANGTL